MDDIMTYDEIHKVDLCALKLGQGDSHTEISVCGSPWPTIDLAVTFKVTHRQSQAGFP